VADAAAPVAGSFQRQREREDPRPAEDASLLAVRYNATDELTCPVRSGGRGQ